MKRQRTNSWAIENRQFKRPRGGTGYSRYPLYASVPVQRRKPKVVAIPRIDIPENKFFDTALSFAIDATGEVPATGQLALIPQGDTSTTRDGRQATITSIQIRASMVYAPGAGAVATGQSFLYLVLDKQCNGAAAAVTDVFTSATLAGAMFNLDNSDRFVILKKWVHVWNPPAGATTAFNNVTQSIEYFKKCNIPMSWSSTAGAITEIRSNNIFLIAGSNAAIDDTIAVGGTCRLRFVG